MSKMLWEVKLPIDIAVAKEDIGTFDLFKYCRPYRMFTSRFRLVNKVTGEDLSSQFMKILFFAGKVVVAKHPVWGIVVGRVVEDTMKRNPNNNLTTIDVELENGEKPLKKLRVGVDCVVIKHDSTDIPPILYIWALANKVLEKESIIDQQDNMLRKPIIVTGEGEDFDNAMNNAQNIMSGLYFLNTKKKKDKNKGTILSDKALEVLNLQLGNSYKGTELWDSRKRYEELLCDYLGYTTTKNEKRERMNSLEVQNENSVGMTFYEETRTLLREGVEKANKMFENELELTELLKKEEVSNNGNQERMERTSNAE